MVTTTITTKRTVNITMTTKRNSYYNIDNDNKKNSNIDKNNNNINKNKNHTIKSITPIATITATVTKMFIKLT